MEGLLSRQQCMAYLVTYSCADLQKLPSREAFAAMVVNAFEQLDVVKVAYWVVGQEDHTITRKVQNSVRIPYHIASRQTRWSRETFQSSNDIQVHFSSMHNTYYNAYKYVTKEDKKFLLSTSHPQLNDPPATEKNDTG